MKRFVLTFVSLFSAAIAVIGKNSTANPTASKKSRIVCKTINPYRGKSEKETVYLTKALTWLRKNQNTDGSWGDTHQGAMTGLALLSFLAHGDTPESTAYGYTIAKSVEWITENGAKFEGRLNMAKQFSGAAAYEHGIATYALCEYYSITKDDHVLPVLRQAVGHIVAGQHEGGGWRYTYNKSPGDLSVSGWQIQALTAAHLTGLDLPGVQAALDKAVKFVASLKGEHGGYGYTTPGDSYGLTGAGIYCSLLWKGERSELRKGMTWLLDETEKNKPVKYDGENANLYAWYFHTQACLLFGGVAWRLWNRWFQDEIIGAQSPDGSWPVPASKGIGPQADSGKTGQVYRTAICTLMLETFYRYSPTPKR